MLGRMDIVDDPLGFVLRLTQEENTAMWRNILHITSENNWVKCGIEKAIDNIKDDNRQRFVTYRELNPDLSCHEVYRQKREYIPDTLRISFTRLRLSSHRLRIETGRWSRTARENRTCSCSDILQDKKHILVCPFNVNVLTQFDYHQDANLGLLHLFKFCDLMHFSLLKRLLENSELH